MNERSIPNGENGQCRTAGGQFAKGNAGGPGNPYARRVAQLRKLMLEAVSEDDVRAIIAALVKRAKAGDLSAAREILNRLVGKPGYIEQADPDRVDLHEAELASDRQQQERTAVYDDLLG